MQPFTSVAMNNEKYEWQIDLVYRSNLSNDFIEQHHCYFIDLLTISNSFYHTPDKTAKITFISFRCLCSDVSKINLNKK